MNRSHQDENQDASVVVDSPLYMFKASVNCWKCHADTEVIALASNNISEAGDPLMRISDESILLSNVIQMPADVLLEIAKRHSNFEFRFSKTANISYYMNYCGSCRSSIGDFFLQKSPGGAFFPAEENTAAKVEIIKLPIIGSRRFVADYGIGGADLIFRRLHPSKPA